MSDEAKNRSVASWGLVGCAYLILQGCGGGTDSESDRATDRDATWGDVPEISISEMPEGLPVWTFPVEPQTRIGVLSGPWHTVFGKIESASFLSSGDFVVADGLNLEIRAFSQDGGHLWTAGGAGQGPGEFESLTFVGTIVGDSVVAFGERGVGNVFDSEGQFVRRIALENVGGEFGVARVVGTTREGNWISWVSAADVPFVQGETEYRGSMIIVIYDRDGKIVRRLEGQFPISDWVRRRNEAGAINWRTVLPPFARRTQISAGSAGFVVNIQDSFDLRVYTSSGTPFLRIQVASNPVPVDERVRDRYVSLPLAAFPDPTLREEIRRQRLEDPLPKTLPAVGRVIVDSQDRIWVEPFTFPGDPVPHWWVFSPDGEPIAHASIPRATLLSIHRIEDGRMLGSFVSPLGVPQVEYHVLR